MLSSFGSKIFRLPVLVVFLVFIILPGKADSGDLKGYQQTLWRHLEAICDFGPRPPGSPALEKLRGYIRSVGKKYADEIREQKFTFQKPGGPTLEMVNIELVFHGKTKKAPLLLGAHYDTRPFADEEKDPYSRKFPIVGANDGGSGTAVTVMLTVPVLQDPSVSQI